MIKLLRTTLLVALFLLALGSPAWADQQAVTINVNGSVLTPDVPAQIMDGRTMVPLRFVSQALGAQVGWDAANQTAIVRSISFTPDAQHTDINATTIQGDGTTLKLEIDGQQVSDVPLANINGRVMVPLRLISESFGGQVNWNDQSRIVTINLINININGRWMKPDVSARLIDGRVMVPLRFIGQGLGATVDWDSGSTTAIVRTVDPKALPDFALQTWEPGLKLVVNANPIADAGLVNLDGSIMVPLRLIGQALWSTVDWNGQTSTVSIQSRPDPKAMLIDSMQKLLMSPLTVNGVGRISAGISGQGLIEITNGLYGVNVPPDQFSLEQYQTIKPSPDPDSWVINVNNLYVQGDDFYTRSNKGLWKMNQSTDFSQYMAQTHPETYLNMVQNGLTIFGDSDHRNSDGHLYYSISGGDSDATGKFTVWFLIDAQTGVLAQINTVTTGSTDYQGEVMKIKSTMELNYKTGTDYALPVITPDQIAPTEPATTNP